MATATGPGPLSVLDGDERAWRERVRAFARDTVGPRVRAMDAAGRIDDGLVKELFAGGLMGIEAPEAYGGAGRGLFHVVLAIEEMARVDPAVAVFVDVQNALIVSALLRHGSGDQKRRYLPRLASDTVGAYAISEELAGSDAFAMTTTARPDGDGFVLSGRKQWITSAAEAGLFLVFARTGEAGPSPSLTAFLVERDTPGLSVGERVEKMGIRASSTCEVVLDDVRVGRENVLGRPDEGGVLMVGTLEIGKVGIAAQLVGLAQGALDGALDHARRRRQFGQPVIDFQGVSFPLAGLAAELQAARVLLYDTARLVARGGTATERLRATSMAKYFASQVAERVASQAVETYGGSGFSTRHLAEKFYRDVKIGKIYEGTSNMQFRTIMATLLSGDGAGDAPSGTGPR
jgi:alkylation response protein AidB-like acyl-CoA dehydrogenase